MVYIVSVLDNQIQRDGKMAITDNWGYVQQMITGSLGLLMLPSAASAESKFQSLKISSGAAGQWRSVLSTRWSKVSPNISRKIPMYEPE